MLTSSYAYLMAVVAILMAKRLMLLFFAQEHDREHEQDTFRSPNTKLLSSFQPNGQSGKLQGLNSAARAVLVTRLDPFHRFVSSLSSLEIKRQRANAVCHA